MKYSNMKAVCLALFSTCAFGSALTVDLGSASAFGVLAGSTVTNTGNTTISGNVGVWPGASVTGFPPGVSGGIFLADAQAQLALTDLGSAFDAAALESCDTNLSGQDLGGLTLTPGVYCFSSSAQLTGTLTFNSQGDPGAVFLIRTVSTLTTATDSSVAYTGGASGQNVYWHVGSSATIGTRTSFGGTILALTSITLNTDASIQEGRALALNGAVTLDSNSITSPVPEPSTLLPLSAFLILVGIFARSPQALRSRFAARQ